LSGSEQPAGATGVRVRTPSRLVYDIGGRGFLRFRGVVGIENRDVGSTLQPQIRFFLFDAEPNMDRLVPPTFRNPLPTPPRLSSASAVVDRIFWFGLGRAPSGDERRIAEEALRNAERPTPGSVADLLWAVLMKPEFQLIY
jgi:hypothetical protein